MKSRVHEHAGGSARGRQPWLAVAAAATLAGSLIAAPVPAQADGSAPPAQADVSLSPPRVRSGVATLPVAVPPDGPTFVPGSLADGAYDDTCDDSGGRAGDLRSVAVIDSPDGDALAFSATTCLPWDVADLAGQWLDFELHRDGDVGGAPDQIVSLGWREDADPLIVAVFDPDAGEPGTWTSTYARAAVRIDGSYGIAGVVPDTRLRTDRFAWTAHLRDGDVVRDAVPNVGLPAPVHPQRCVAAAAGATVVTRAGATSEPAAAIRRLGLAVGAVADGAGVVEVPFVANLDRLRDLPGVIDVSRSPVWRPLQPPAAGAPHRVSGLAATVPEDPMAAQQWSLAAVRAPVGWQVATSSALRIAVIDDGVDATRPDLAGRVGPGWDAVAGRAIPAGANSDLGGHGTKVAGVAAATGANGRGLTGIDWGATVLPYRVFDHAGCGTDGPLAAAIERATDDGADVINLSLGGESSTRALEAAVAYATANGVVVVAASGNSGTTGQATYPAALDGVVAVGATTPDDSVASYSNRGGFIDLVAPGGGAGEDGMLVLDDRDQLGRAAGTSFAAPMVAGAAALWRSRHPEADPAAVARALTGSARDLGPAGRDDVSGHGLLDLGALLGGDRPMPVLADTSAVCADAPADVFADAAGSVHRGSIDCLWARGISEGKEDGRFAPSERLSRGQIASFLVRTAKAAGAVVPTGVADAYGDDDGTVHEGNLNVLAAWGVLPTASAIVPSERIDRGEMASLTWGVLRHVGLAEPVGVDWFADDDTHPFEDDINRLAAVGVVQGKGDGTFRPAERLSRGQMAAFLTRALATVV